MSAALQILVFATEYPPRAPGGLGAHVFELASGLVREGHRVVVVVPREGAGTADEVSLGVTVLRREASDATRRLSTLLREENFGEDHPDAFEAYNADAAEHAHAHCVATDFRPDVVHVHDWFFIPGARAVAARLGVPLVVTFHILWYPQFHLWGATVEPFIADAEALACRDAAAVIAVSEAVRAVVRETHGVPDTRLHVVHNGFDVDRFVGPPMTDSEARALRLRLAPEGKKIIVYAGRISPEKGVLALLESAERVLHEYGSAHYVLVGDASPEVERQITERLAAHPKLADSVTRIAAVPRAELPQFYRVADVAVVPSVYDSFPYAALEAMSLGVPVVATRVGGVPEIVVDGVTGLLVPLAPEALARAQLTLLRDASLARRMGEAARERVRAEFSLKKMVASTAAIYRAVAAIRARGGPPR